MKKKHICLSIEPIPSGSYCIRGYTREGSLTYDIFCLVEPRGEGEYEICKWITHGNQYSVGFLDKAFKLIKGELGDVKITGAFEERLFKIYKKYFSRNGFTLKKIKEYAINYNNVEGNVIYCEIKRKG